MDIYDIFKKLFPFEKSVRAYYSHGKSTIVIWFKDRDPMMFTYKDKSNWVLKPYIILGDYFYGF